ncbi:MAG: glycerol-3-phosphate dehydrogenase [Euryarchaeota archaeon]|nr:glycerol-3-phosphate dehydrogenase [Euryarchaeota archaeon]
MSKMSHIAILGLGNWGTALAKTWLDAKHDVSGWTIEKEVYESVTSKSINEKYLPDIELSNMYTTMRLEECLENAEIIVLALPSSVILDVVKEVVPFLRPSHVLIDLAKGLSPEGGSISEEIIEILRSNEKLNPVAVMTGPTIAPEVAKGVITTALIACNDEFVANKLVQRLTTEHLLLQATDDPTGAELWGAYKNIVALACGISDGLKKVTEKGGDNLKAAIFARGFSEGCLLLSEMGAKPSTAFGPAGIGDLYVTAASPYGRNRTLGEKLGTGLNLEKARAEMHMVSEGVNATYIFHQKLAERGINNHFISTLKSLLDDEIDAESCLTKLLS